MKKIFFLLLLISVNLFAEEFSLNIEIRNVSVSTGKVYVGIYNSSDAYKNGNALKSYVLESSNPILTITEMVPEGEYLVSIYQDTNQNKKLDTNILGIPKEPVGISNYDGKGIPGGFDKMKMRINKDNAIISVQLYKI